MRVVGVVVLLVAVVKFGVWLAAGAKHATETVLSSLRDGLVNVAVFAGVFVAAVLVATLLVLVYRVLIGVVRGALAKPNKRSEGERLPAVQPRHCASAVSAAERPAVAVRSAKADQHVPVEQFTVQPGPREDDDDEHFGGFGISPVPARPSVTEGLAARPPSSSGWASPRRTVSACAVGRETHRSSGSGDGGVRERNAEEPREPARRDLNEAASPQPSALFVLGCRAVQLGDQNWQFLRYRWDLNLRVDFAPILAKPAVKSALAQLALEPDNEQLRAFLTKQMCIKRWEFLGRTTLDLGSVSRPRDARSAQIHSFGSVQSPTATMAVIQDCQGVQIGDYSRQSAEFVYRCASRVNEFRLLREHPAVATALVDTVIGLADPGPTGPLHTELVHALKAQPVDLPSYGEVISTPSRTTVRDVDGLSFGVNSQVYRCDELAPQIPSLPRETKRQVTTVQKDARRRLRSAELSARNLTEEPEPAVPPRPSVYTAAEWDVTVPGPQIPDPPSSRLSSPSSDMEMGIGGI